MNAAHVYRPSNAATISVMTLAMMLSLASATSIVEAGFVAQAGFNDASGINSNATPNSPYTLGGPVGGAGVGEPVWSGPWQSDSVANVVVTSPVFEGDGAARLNPTSGTGRELIQHLNGKFQVEQYVQFAAGARLVTYTEQAPGGNALQGPIWQAFADGKFYVIDGVEDAGSPPSQFTGFTWQPGVWYKVDILGDMTTRTWDFFLNDIKYIPPNPLGFRGSPAYIDRVFYQSEGSGSVFLDAVTIVPEPSSLVLAAFGFIGLVVWGWRRK